MRVRRFVFGNAEVCASTASEGLQGRSPLDSRVNGFQFSGMRNESGKTRGVLLSVERGELFGDPSSGSFRKSK